MPESFRIAAYQGQAEPGSIRQRLELVKSVVVEAEAAGAAVLVFPEGFLTGYFPDRDRAWATAIGADDPAFAELHAVMSGYSLTMILGFNELQDGRIHNAVAVLEAGRCQGIYRKSYLIHGHHTPGREYPVFQKDGVCFGVLICLDTMYLEPCRVLARRGAKLVLCPMDNRVTPQHPYAQRPPYYSHLVARTFENNCWLLSADVVHADGGRLVCPGHTVGYDNDGLEVLRSQEGVPGLVFLDIPRASLERQKTRRLFGDPDIVKVYMTTERLEGYEGESG